MLIKKLATVTTTGILLLGSFAPTAAFANTVIAGNGFASDNAAQVSRTNDTTVDQNNTAEVNNHVDSQLTTGNNSANNLTGGSASIFTGDAVATVGISNAVNMNQAHLDGVGGSGNGQLLIEGNGAGSSNAGNETSSDNTSLFQTNNADLRNRVDTKADTGNNETNNLTGGDASIRTGTTQTVTDIMNEANSNTAHLFGGLGNGLGGNTGVIAGNGSFSASSADLNSQHDLTVVQDNNADFNNKVGGHLNTGWNSADNGTNGSASILTGGAYANTNVRNLANENNAMVDMVGGTGNGLDKILSNGAYSVNSLTDNSNSNLSVFGTNNADLTNHVGPKLTTGNNSLDNETGGIFFIGDPSVRTGQAVQQTSIQNEANDNQLGAVNLGGQAVSFSFDPVGLLGGLF